MRGHRKTVKRFHEPGDCHELTFSCYRRIPLLTNDDWPNLLAESLDHAVQGQSCRLIAYVFMPEHVHILIQPVSRNAGIDLFLKALKTPSVGDSAKGRPIGDGPAPVTTNKVGKVEVDSWSLRRFTASHGNSGSSLRMVDAGMKIVVA
jgi:Transposase IS200 like